MNSYKKVFIIPVLIVSVLGCNKIKEDDYYKPFSGTSERKMLLEDFTGHECGNCPQAAKIARDLKDGYKENLVVIAMHAGNTFATPGNYPYQYDFRTPEGELLNTTYNIDPQGLPKGMVNRKAFNGRTVIERGEWGTDIGGMINTRPDMVLSFASAARYDSTTHTVSIDSIACKIASADIGLVDYKIQVYLIEDSIIQAQEDYSQKPPHILNYVHNHVFRTSATGAFGEPFIKKELIETAKKADKLRDQVYKTKPYKIPVTTTATRDAQGRMTKGGWNPKHLLLVAFVSRADNNEVIQVEEVHVQEF